LEATASDPSAALNPASAMLVRGRYKLTYYFGYEELQKTGPLFELYDIENDPEELHNIYEAGLPIVQELKTELVEKIKQVDKPYLKH
jgi:arylsulfatase A-like enzyme